MIDHVRETDLSNHLRRQCLRICRRLLAEVGSEEWCADMKEKPKGDWSANEAADFAKHCVL